MTVQACGIVKLPLQKISKLKNDGYQLVGYVEEGKAARASRAHGSQIRMARVHGIFQILLILLAAALAVSKLFLAKMRHSQSKIVPENAKAKFCVPSGSYKAPIWRFRLQFFFHLLAALSVRGVQGAPHQANSREKEGGEEAAQDV